MSLKKYKFKLNNHRTQSVIVGDGSLDYLISIIRSSCYSKVLFLIDKKVYSSHYKKLVQLYHRIKISKNLIIFPISRAKSINSLLAILRHYEKSKLDRKSCIVAIGGGRISDIAGLAAAIYFRGIDFIQVGTTFMTQADAIIGKVAIDLCSRKNLIGNFSSPVLTICDTKFLQTNSDLDIKNGLIEVIKHGLISSKTELNKVEGSIYHNKENLKNLPFDYLIYKSLKIKSHFVARDFYDNKNIHNHLSYGHTIANALEELTKYGLKHGQAVSIGMRICAEYAKRVGLIKKSFFERHNRLIESIFKFYIPKKASIPDIIRHLEKDKMSVGGKIRMVLLKDIGNVTLKNISPKILATCLKKFYR